MIVLQLVYCSGEVKEAQLPREEAEAIAVWKEIADNVLLRKPQKADALGQGHLVRVSVIDVSDLDPNDPGHLALSVFRHCADIHPEVRSKANEPKLYVTGAVA
jgi:hypothetical protein